MTAKRSDHEYVPVHEKADEKEVRAFLEKRNLKIENLPKILSDDPQVVKLSAKEGQVIKVRRNDHGNEYLYYRLVVK